MSRAAADATVFHAIADPNRRAILELLFAGEMAVSAILESFSITQSALSQHLAVLRSAGLVIDRRVGRHRLYSVNAAPLQEVADWVEPFERFWDERLDNLGKYLEKQRVDARTSKARVDKPPVAPPQARGGKPPVAPRTRRKARR